MKRAAEIWRSARLGTRGVDLRLARGATLIIVPLSIHSFVDYPLRTAAVQAIMAFACGLLAPAKPETASLPHEDAGKQAAETRRRHAPVRAGVVPPAGRMPAGGPSQETGGELWGENITWPEAWRKGPQG
jgi:hypothetical protein